MSAKERALREIKDINGFTAPELQEMKFGRMLDDFKSNILNDNDIVSCELLRTMRDLLREANSTVTRGSPLAIAIGDALVESSNVLKN